MKDEYEGFTCSICHPELTGFETKDDLKSHIYDRHGLTWVENLMKERKEIHADTH